VVIVISATIIVGVIVGVWLDWADNQIGYTETVKSAARSLSGRLGDIYADIENQILAMYMNMTREALPPVP
jgi:hypothetical protein